MNPTIVIESGTEELSGPPRELLCSVWPLFYEGDQFSLGEPVFSNHMVLVGTQFIRGEDSTLQLPEAGAYLIDVGFPNGHSLRTTISVNENENYRLIVRPQKQTSVISDKERARYHWVPKVVSAALRRNPVMKMDLTISVVTQRYQTSLSGLYEFASELGKSTHQKNNVFDCPLSEELSYELPLLGQSIDEASALEFTSERKWLMVSGKGKIQTLISYPYGWVGEKHEVFKLMLGRKSIDGKDACKWSVALKPEDPIYGSFIEYLTRRDLISSASISESSRGKAAVALYKKRGNPYAAAAAAYMFALGGSEKPEHQDWMETLSSRYLWLPDGAIALGWKLLREGKNDSVTWSQAQDLFALAFSRGLPYYTVGLHILVEALTLLRMVRPKDSQIRNMLAAAKAADVACIRTEPFTTLQVSRYLGLPMKRG